MNLENRRFEWGPQDELFDGSERVRFPELATNKAQAVFLGGNVATARSTYDHGHREDTRGSSLSGHRKYRGVGHSKACENPPDERF